MRSKNFAFPKFRTASGDITQTRYKKRGTVNGRQIMALWLLKNNRITEAGHVSRAETGILWSSDFFSRWTILWFQFWCLWGEMKTLVPAESTMLWRWSNRDCGECPCERRGQFFGLKKIVFNAYLLDFSFVCFWPTKQLYRQIILLSFRSNWRKILSKTSM